MRGKKQVKKRKIKPDKRYKSSLVAELINKILLCGQKETAQKITYQAFKIIEEKTKKQPLHVFERAVKIASPLLEVRSKRIGGATYQVPMEVSDWRKIDLVFRWLVTSARSKKSGSMATHLANEILAMHKGEGTVMTKRENLHKMAEANKAFAHFARF